MLLQDDGRTTWVRERLLKEKRDLDVLTAITLEPACDLAAVAQAAAELGERGIVRGAVPGFPVYGQPGLLAGRRGAVRHRAAHPRDVRRPGLGLLAAVVPPGPEARVPPVGRAARRSTWSSSAAATPRPRSSRRRSSTASSPRSTPRSSRPPTPVRPARRLPHVRRDDAVLERIADMGPDAMETFTPPSMGGDTRMAEAKRRVGARVCDDRRLRPVQRLRRLPAGPDAPGGAPPVRRGRPRRRLHPRPVRPFLRRPTTR